MIRTELDEFLNNATSATTIEFTVDLAITDEDIPFIEAHASFTIIQYASLKELPITKVPRWPNLLEITIKKCPNITELYHWPMLKEIVLYNGNVRKLPLWQNLVMAGIIECHKLKTLPLWPNVIKVTCQYCRKLSILPYWNKVLTVHLAGLRRLQRYPLWPLVDIVILKEMKLVEFPLWLNLTEFTYRDLNKKYTLILPEWPVINNIYIHCKQVTIPTLPLLKTLRCYAHAILPTSMPKIQYLRYFSPDDITIPAYHTLRELYYSATETLPCLPHIKKCGLLYNHGYKRNGTYLRTMKIAVIIRLRSIVIRWRKLHRLY